MSAKLSKKYYIIPVLYISIILLLVYMQFSTTKQFSENYLSINMTGSTRSGSKNHENNISAIETDIHGIRLVFSKSSPVVLKDSKGSVSRPALSGYRKNSESIDILFSDSFSIKISLLEGKEAKYIISPETPPGKKITEISIPFSVDSKEKIEKSLYFPVFGYESDDGIYFLATEGKNSEVRYDDGVIALAPDKNGRFGITVTESGNGISDPHTFWLTENMNLEETAEEKELERLFTDRAYKGWRTDRFSLEAGGWTDRNGSAVYSKDIISSLGSELLRRRGFSQNQGIFRLAQEKNREKAYLESALLTGGTAAAYRNMQAQDLLLIEEISAGIKRNDTSVFRIDDLVSIITDRGPYSLIQELFLMAENLEIEALDMETAYGVASAYLDFVIINMEKERSLEKFNAILNTKILGKIVLNSGGIFLAVEGDKSETPYTIKTARLLKKAAKAAERPVLKQIGCKLISSIIAFAGEDGFVPEFIYADKNTVKSSEGRIEPEYIYPELKSARYLPVIKSLKNEIAPGAWIATCADTLNSTASAAWLTVETTFPAGESEHIIIQGIQSVSGVKLYGVNWNTAADYEKYFAGWVYVSESQTLFIKVQHRQEKETITITY